MDRPSSSRKARVNGTLRAGASRRALVAGLMQASLVAGVMHVATPAQAADDVSKAYSLGDSWQNWSWAQSGNPLSYDNNQHSNLNVVNDRGVAVWSGGGHADNGHDGGYGGSVLLHQYGNLAGWRADNADYADWAIQDSKEHTRRLTDTNQRFSGVRVVPMIFVLSQGGAGGDDGSWRGRGGRGRNVTFNLYGSVSTTGASYAGVWLSSTGMLAGWGGSDSGRADYLNDDLPSAGDVWGTVAAGASITTNGAGSPGLVVEGVGGDGGGNWNGSGEKWPSRGGAGGVTYGVTVTHSGTITTAGANSPGIIAQSIGGRGSQQQADTSSAHNGGAGGNAYPVWVHMTNSGVIKTSGDHSYGIAVYSVGGLGSSGSQHSTWGSGSYAGDNGAGSDASVTLDSGSAITTRGASAYAVLVQSFGGGTAAGYFNPHAGDTSAKGGDSGIWGHGGDGSRGGAAGSAGVNSQATLQTHGNDAHTIVAQSLGGLGGDGGDATKGSAFLAVALGGNGGYGGSAGAVTVNNGGGSLTTYGDSAAGIVAQSIGGGGGNGGAANAYSAGIIGSVSVAVGGSGGSGGAGGKVDVANNSVISTDGANASGVYAQSIGGGGGHGGSASTVAAAFGLEEFPAVSVGISIGGSAGSGAHAGAVNVSNSAYVKTLGANSYGLTGQSIGGGGGDGGGATSYVLSAATYSMGVNSTVGATGGAAGNASSVTISHSSNAISTAGNGAHGIYGMSIGGGGGSGGSTSASADVFKGKEGVGLAFNLGLGGKGGGGGSGSAVTVGLYNYASITTTGNFANGVFAQSVGGGGGSGGNADTSAGTGLLFGDTISDMLGDSRFGGIIALQSAVGGNAGGGGKGDVVTVNLNDDSSIVTWGPNSHGVFAQSIGGGGGTAGGYSDGGSGRLNVQANVGGSGGDGGYGGAVNISNGPGSSITTYSDSAHGVYAQSIGGGGGSGGSMTSEKDGDGDAAASFVSQVRKVMGVDRFQDWVDNNQYKSDYETVSGLAHLVQDTGILSGYEKQFRDELISKLYNSKLVQDHNWFSDYFVKSGKIDEDGNVLPAKDEPEKKSMSLTVGVGGSGGLGGNGGAIGVSNAGAISTSGLGAHGVYAQSVGGGGGAGGLASSSNSDGNTINLNVTVGGSGGSGGAGGAVTITNGGQVATARDSSIGLYAQSIGGGGGVGGGSISPETKGFTANFQVGGSGGSGGSGGAANVSNAGQIATSGSESHGVVAHSIGGGGGAVTMNMGSNWDPSDDEEERLNAKIDVADKIGTIMGAGGAKLFKSESYEEQKKKAGEKLLELVSFTVRIGGTGGSGGAGGNVQVHNTGAITTKGQAAIGVLAQSVGGGGGLFSSTGKLDLNHGWDLKFRGHNGGAGNHGGAVTVTFDGLTGSIATSGDGAHAILAQSIGGGGGYLGRTPGSAGNIMSDSATGDGGAVSVSMSSSLNSITTIGAGANGIYAQSIGGGGGAWANVDDYYNADPTQPSSQTRANASGKGGAININSLGSISATGVNANAILAQSGKQMTNGAIDPSSAGGPINISLTGGNYVGGSGQGVGVRIDGGSKDINNPNYITIGDGASVSALSNVAIRTHSGGSDFVQVYGGKLTGDVILTDNNNNNENNILRVQDGGYYKSRSGYGVVTLGQGTFSGNWLDVWSGGSLDVGGVNNISTLAVTGSMNIDGGRLLVDVDVSPQTGARSHDTIWAAGDIHLQGQGSPAAIKVHVVNGLLPGNFDIFNKTPQLDGKVFVYGGAASPIFWTVENGGRSIAPQAYFVETLMFASEYASAGQTYTILTADGTITLPPMHRRFRASKSEYLMLDGLQQAWDGGNLTHAALFGFLANVQTAADYQQAAATLSTDGYQGGAAAQTQGASSSMGAAMSCPVFTGASMTLNETQCVWGRISGSWAKQDGARPGHGVKQDDFTYRIGAQWEVAPQWFFGVTGAYVASNTSTKSGHIRSFGKGGDVSVALKHQMGNWLLALSGHIGYGAYETSHRINIGGRTWGNNADQDVWTGGLRMRAAYEMAFQSFYIRPYLDLDVIHTYMPSFRSSGSFLHAYHFDAMREWTLSASPNVEFGSRINLGETTWLRPYVSVGATVLHESELATNVRFDRAGAGFTSTHKMDDKFLDFGAGLQLFTNDMLELRAEYKARIGENYTRHDASGRMSIRF